MEFGDTEPPASGKALLKVTYGVEAVGANETGNANGGFVVNPLTRLVFG